MLSTTHTATAMMVLALPLPLWLTIPLAVASHVVMDMLGESTYVDWVKYQIGTHGALAVLGLATGLLPLFISGMLLGNALDIFDKIISQKLFKKEIVHSNPLYPPVLINLTGKQTKAFDIGLTLLVILGVLCL